VLKMKLFLIISILTKKLLICPTISPRTVAYLYFRCPGYTTKYWCPQNTSLKMQVSRKKNAINYNCNQNLIPTIFFSTNNITMCSNPKGKSSRSSQNLKFLSLYFSLAYRHFDFRLVRKFFTRCHTLWYHRI
jgi:hypothetical protein